jgi:alginate O-acetyltransferase complex protein AlgI
MWTIALALFAVCKWLTWQAARSSGLAPGAPRSAGYLFGWVGMDARAFLRGAAGGAKPAPAEWIFAASKTAFGAALLWLMLRRAPEESVLLRGWIGLTGLVFLLHFGVFHLLALAWQGAGIDAPPIMRAPILATSVAEFWGKRWNVAFHQIVHDLAFRPLRLKLGPAPATLVVFFLSGLVHEAVISLPARGGYGLPTIYFLLQGLAVLWERSRLGRQFGFGRGWTGWLWALACTAGPAGLLFHPPFITRVILPFLRAIGAF